MAATTASRIFAAAYSLLWKAARPVLRRQQRLARDFDQRLVPSSWALPSPAACWIQAASGGEAYLVRQLVRELAVLLPPAAPAPFTLLATSCTRQGIEVLEAVRQWAQENAPQILVHVRCFPLDAPEIMDRALQLASPGAVALLETELWPGLMLGCAARHIPVLVLNGRMREKSLRRYRFLRFIWDIAAPCRVIAASPPDARRFAALFGEDRVRCAHNIKFDGLGSPDAAQIALPALADMETGLSLVLLASVRQEEEEAMRAALGALFGQDRPVCVVLAPRHMERAAFWAERLGELAGAYGWRLLLRSAFAADEKLAAKTVVLWDAFGELQALYGRADAVFVGGSLAPLGGQNFLEAAAAGVVPVIGPSWSNFAWAGEEFFDAGLARRIDSAAELAPVLLRQLELAEARDAVRARFDAYLAQRKGGARYMAERLLEACSACQSL